MKTAPKLSVLVALAALTIAGCSPEDNPVAPPAEAAPPAVEIRTPKSLIVRKIVVTGFDKNRPDGSTWDWDPLSAEARKPDIRVSLQRDGALPAYVSDTRKNASYTGSYTFTQPASVHDGSLPHEIIRSRTYRIYLVDDDFGGDETMARATIRLSSLYGKDNASGIDKTISGSNGFRVRVIGDWVY